MNKVGFLVMREITYSYTIGIKQNEKSFNLTLEIYLILLNLIFTVLY